MTGVREIEAELRELGGAERAAQEKRYLKSDFVHLGVPLPTIRKVATAAVRAKPGRAELLALAAGLWDAEQNGVPIHEMRMAAVEVLIKRRSVLVPADLGVAERLIRDSASWVYVDALAEKIVGDLVLRDPASAARLDVWVRDPYLWIRRAAVLALLAGVRIGEPDLDRLSRYGDALIEEKEFFIRKAVGWVLREVSKKDPGWVYGWVAARTGRISGVTVREAVRHLPKADAERIMADYRAR